MRSCYCFTLSAILLLLTPALAPAQDAEGPSRSVAGGGITVQGWSGKIDAGEQRQGKTIADAKFSQEGNGFHVITGPAVSYWNPANTASGDYTVKATFNEPKYMNLNTHPHPYGIFIAGTGLGTDKENYLYCAAYGSGVFIVRGFGPEPFQVNGRRGEPNDAVHKAAGVGQPVSQEIAVSVAGGHVKCSINGTVVGDYEKSAVVAPGKLAGEDGVYGLRFAHNTEVVVTGFGVTKP
ncbi:MAG TPA: hypothetical protein VHW24_08390 [Bryobacteraceae bacterium]|nr:hypothetical protein [Bryobacteraceae bacterium]